MQIALVVQLLSLLAAPCASQELLPRRPLPKETVGVPMGSVLPGAPAEAMPEQVVVKFVDPARARAAADGTLRSRANVDLSAATELVDSLGGRFEPLLRLPEARLAELEGRAARGSGRAQPDLAGLLVVRLPADDRAALQDAAAAFRALDLVEFAYVQVQGAEPSGDIAPPTPDLTGLQFWQEAPAGLDGDYLKNNGLDGTGLRISDCEFAWIESHEDLVDKDLHPEPGQTPDPLALQYGYQHHGAAIVGMTSAGVNGYGCDGMVPAAEIYTYPAWTVEQGWRIATSIANAIAGSSTGDFVLIEMQTLAGVTVEVDPAVWLVVKTGTDAGVIVVAAAGNGGQDLDSPSYASYMALGNSGAILVGAGVSDASHAKIYWSTFGSRVDVQGWGMSVFTLGYGYYATYGGDVNQTYVHDFNGTSSAAAMVTIAAVAVQEHVLKSGAPPLSPQYMRDLLVMTGIPQLDPVEHIGPFPDIEAAVAAIGCQIATNYCIAAPNSTGAGAVMAAHGAGSLSTNELVLAAYGLPPAQVAMFIYGQGTSQLPVGNGWLCVSGNGSLVYRLLPPAHSSSTGMASYALDLTVPPASAGSGAITPGSTWNFQCWYRDPAAGGAGYNFTDAIAIPFCN